jgi:hypothetical protein
MVCNPTRSAGSPARTGTHICTKVGGSHNESLLPPSPHLWLGVDLVVGGPMLKVAIWKGLILIIGKHKNLRVKHHRPVNPLEETAPPCFYKINSSFNHIDKGLVQIEITEVKKEKLNTHNSIATTIICTSGRRRISRLLHMSLFIVVT